MLRKMLASACNHGKRAFSLIERDSETLPARLPPPFPSTAVNRTVVVAIVIVMVVVIVVVVVVVVASTSNIFSWRMVIVAI